MAPGAGALRTRESGALKREALLDCLDTARACYNNAWARTSVDLAIEVRGAPSPFCPREAHPPNGRRFPFWRGARMPHLVGAHLLRPAHRGVLAKVLCRVCGQASFLKCMPGLSYLVGLDHA